MKTRANRFLRPLPGIAAALLPALALAHTGAGGAHVHSPFLAGFLHPFTGADHLAAMLAVGAWSALAVRPVWLAPLAFVAMLAAGALAAFAGPGVPAVEPLIAASLLVMGLLVAVRARVAPAWAAALVGGFAFFHGAAHGAELARDAMGASALLGMVLATAALHGAGIALGNGLLQRRPWLRAAAGGGVALLGSALLLGLA